MAKGKRLAGDLIKLSGVQASQQIGYEDIKNLTNADLKEFKAVITKMNSVANKRSARMQESTGEITGQHFSVKGIKNINDAKRAFKEVKDFLNNESKSLSGQARTRIKSANRLRDQMKESGLEFNKADVDWMKDPSNYDRFWRAYEEMRKNENYNMQYKYQALEELKRVAIDNPYADPNDLANMMESKLDGIYKSSIEALYEANEDFDDIDDYDDADYDDSDMPWA